MLLTAALWSGIFTLGASGTEKQVATSPPAAALRLADLLKVQATVQESLTKVRPAVVAIQTGDGTASGVIINAEGLILTAAHVAEKPGRNLRVILEDGKAVTGKTLGLDSTTDAALMQIVPDTKEKEKDKTKAKGREPEKKTVWPFVNVSRDVGKTQPGSWCYALGHPGGFDKDRGVVLRVGKVVKQSANVLQTDCVLMGGDSGGPLLNLQGEVIGIHSQIWEGRDENMHVSMAPFLRSWDQMKSSQVIRVWSTGCGGYLGIATQMNDKGWLEVLDVLSGSPAEKAGLVTGDAILRFNEELMTEQPQFSAAVRARAPGDDIRLRIRRADVEREVQVILGTMPKEEG